MDTTTLSVIFNLFRVRKLTGKPVADTTPDCEFEARRIHKPVFIYENCVPFLAAKSNALRIQSDLLCGDLAIAASIALFSSGDTLAPIKMPLVVPFGSFWPAHFSFHIVFNKMFDRNLIFV